MPQNDSRIAVVLRQAVAASRSVAAQALAVPVAFHLLAEALGASPRLEIAMVTPYPTAEAPEAPQAHPWQVAVRPLQPVHKIEIPTEQLLPSAEPAPVQTQAIRQFIARRIRMN